MGQVDNQTDYLRNILKKKENISENKDYLSRHCKRLQRRQDEEDGREGDELEAVHGRDGRADAAQGSLGRQSKG